MLNTTTTIQQQRAFLLEFNSWEDTNNWGDPQTDLLSAITLAQNAGFRTFAATHDNAISATIENHLQLYNLGFDVAYTYNLTNAIQARRMINSKRGIVPP
jgi:hypothetical protein